MNTSILPYKESRTNVKQRKHILETTMQLILENGLENTTMVGIAETAEITRRTVYNYYDTKEDIAADIQIIALEELTWYNFLTLEDSRINLELLEDLGSFIFTEKKEYLHFSAIYSFYFAGQKPHKALKKYEKNKANESNVEKDANTIKIMSIFFTYLQRVIISGQDYSGKKEEIYEMIKLILATIKSKQKEYSLC